MYKFPALISVSDKPKSIAHHTSPLSRKRPIPGIMYEINVKPSDIVLNATAFPRKIFDKLGDIVTEVLKSEREIIIKNKGPIKITKARQERRIAATKENLINKKGA
jgi:hypothetical protein